MKRALILVAAFACVSACSAPDDPIAQGKELYDACLPCHGAGGEGTPAVGAPEIAGLPEWYIDAQVMKFRAAKRAYHFDDLAGLRMRPMAMSLANEDEVHTVAHYIASLPRPAHAPTLQGGNVEHGKQLFAVCVTCHAADGGGNQALNAPPIAGADDWYLVAQLGKFKNKVRGDGAVDPIGATMQAMSMTLANEQDMKDVVAYIKSLPVKSPAPPKGGT